jgi:uncharacterized membrane protein YbaN (DUF454 family)
MPRFVYMILGWIAVALGVIGAFLPLLPTTVFLILAAFLFGRGSPRARAWLIGHRVFGPPILNWEATGAISRPAKAWACAAMALTIGLSWIFGAPGPVLGLQAVALAAAAAFILTRPG